MPGVLCLVAGIPAVWTGARMVSTRNKEIPMVTTFTQPMSAIQPIRYRPTVEDDAELLATIREAMSEDDEQAPICDFYAHVCHLLDRR